jgi:predicted phage terminase large subunit-like protein
MSHDDQRKFQAVLRQNFYSFVQKAFQEVAPEQDFHKNWHVEAIAWHLQRVAAGETTRLVITLPPRHLKSICGSVAFPAWILGHDPTNRVICVSYAESLAKKHSLDCRRVMQALWYRQMFHSARLSEEQNTALEFATAAGGSRLATSVAGTITGRGGNIIIIDDPLKPEEALSETQRNKVNDWYDRTLYSRLDDKSCGAIVIIMQRLHLEDLAGHVLENGGWEHLNLPAIAETREEIPVGPDVNYIREPGELLHPAREPQKILDEIRRQLGSFNFSAQYQQDPLPADGEIIRWRWFHTYQPAPVWQPGDQIVQSWDTAMKVGADNDFSVGTTWLVRGCDYCLLDVVRERLLYPDLKARIIAEARHYHTQALLIEDTGTGTGLIQDLQRAGPADVPKPIPMRPRMDKLTRMQIQSAKIEAGHVYLPRQAPWLAEFRREFLQFPHGRYDDQVDSVSQFLTWIEARRSPQMVARVTLF